MSTFKTIMYSKNKVRSCKYWKCKTTRQCKRHCEIYKMRKNVCNRHVDRAECDRLIGIPCDQKPLGRWLSGRPQKRESWISTRAKDLKDISVKNHRLKCLNKDEEEEHTSYRDVHVLCMFYTCTSVFRNKKFFRYVSIDVCCVSMFLINTLTVSLYTYYVSFRKRLIAATSLQMNWYTLLKQYRNIVFWDGKCSLITFKRVKIKIRIDMYNILCIFTIKL